MFFKGKMQFCLLLPKTWYEEAYLYFITSITFFWNWCLTNCEKKNVLRHVLKVMCIRKRKSYLTQFFFIFVIFSLNNKSIFYHILLSPLSFSEFRHISLSINHLIISAGVYQSIHKRQNTSFSSITSMYTRLLNLYKHRMERCLIGNHITSSLFYVYINTKDNPKINKQITKEIN